MTGQIQGINKLAQLQRLLHDSQPDLPVTAIGGINQHNIESVLQTGVKSVAVVTAITQAPDPELAVQATSTGYSLYFHHEQTIKTR